MDILSSLKKEGHNIILVTHNIHEINNVIEQIKGYMSGYDKINANTDIEKVLLRNKELLLNDKKLST